MLLASEAIDYVTHALGGSLSADIPPLTIINQAGKFLFSLHPWRFKQSRQALLDLRGPITLTGATWTEATRTVTKVGAFTSYRFLQGDGTTITGGTGAATGAYKIESRVDNDKIVLEQSIGSAADGMTNIAGTIVLDTVALPDDFESLIPPRGVAGRQPASTQYGFRLCVPEELLLLRSNSASTLDYSGFVGAIGSAWTKKLQPKSVLDIYPAPSQSVTGAFGISYNADFVTVTDANEVLRLPEHMELLYLQLARAIAQGYEEADNESMTKRLAEITADLDNRTGGRTLYHFAKMRDGAVQPSYGRPMASGALARGVPAWPFPPFQAPTPS